MENLFYNTPTRLSALRTSSEEYGRILDVVTKYAIHNPRVSFVCKKVCFRYSYLPALLADLLYLFQSGSGAPDVTTPSGSTTRQTIRQLYGQAIAKDLLEASMSSIDDNNTISGNSDAMDVEETWSAEAFFTNANYQAKRFVFLLFINRKLSHPGLCVLK